MAILQTTVEAIGEKAGKFGAMRLCDLEKKTKLQNELRKLLGFKIQRGQRGLLMSYSTSREKEILKACFNPKPDSTQWQVNAFVYTVHSLIRVRSRIVMWLNLQNPGIFVDR